MPWTKSEYPASMKNLPARVRNKAIEIANAIIEEKETDEGIAIATAISRAKDWAANRDMKTENSGSSRSTDVKQHGQDRYVIPYEGKKWAVKTEGEKKTEEVFTNKKQAVKKAREEARKANASLTIQKRTGQVEKRISYNPRKRAVKQTR
ncbi:MAG TPA: DUF2188 domain-containing protein [Bacteroidales bacterium]|nr:DUF2188 domain-containing protein [Bacteroidales bacterium]